MSAKNLEVERLERKMSNWGPNGMISTEFQSQLDCCHTLSLNKSGSLALLAGRTVLASVNIDSPDRICSKMERLSRHDVQETQFSYENDSLCAIAINNKVELIDCYNELKSTALLTSHSRRITDLSWHEQKTNLLATSSLDHFIYIWDVRDTRKPAISLQSCIGADQVCWERMAGETLASSHEGEIRLWDIRSPEYAKVYINAHNSKILSMDFSSNRKGYLVSSSRDHKVKFWNVDGLSINDTSVRPEREFETPQTPVWKVRFTPFGDGLVTLMLNTLLRDENNLMLWNTHDLSTSVHTFFGHNEMVLEFCWRNIDLNQDRDQFQLVSWGKDKSMKIWKIGNNLRKMCERTTFNLDEDFSNSLLDDDSLSLENPCTGTSISLSPVASIEDLPITGSISTASESGVLMGTPEVSETSEKAKDCLENLDDDDRPIFLKTTSVNESADNPNICKVEIARGRSLSPAVPHSDVLATSVPSRSGIEMEVRQSKKFLQPINLEQEFRLVNLSETLILEARNSSSRSCVILGKTHKSVMHLQITFPEGYPYQTAPIFKMLDATTIEKRKRDDIIAKLIKIAEQVVAKNNRCVDICLRQLENSLQILSKQERAEELGHIDRSSHVLGGRQDENVPFPRTSGARFCSWDKLVVFSANTLEFISNAKIGGKTIKETPRSLAACASLNLENNGNSAQYYGQSPSFRQRMFRRTNKARMSSIGSSISEDTKSESEASKVVIMNCNRSQPLFRSLAENYCLSSKSISEICSKNAAIANLEKHKFIAETWALLSVCCQIKKSDIKELQPWIHHPMGRQLLENRLYHHLRSHDIQTVATVACVLYSPEKDSNAKSLFSNIDRPTLKKNTYSSPMLKRNYSGFYSELNFVDTGRDAAMEAVSYMQPSLANFQKYYYSKQTSEPSGTLFNEVSSQQDSSRDDNEEEEEKQISYELLSENKEDLYEFVKKRYAEALRQMGLLTKSALIYKHVKLTQDEKDSSKISLTRICEKCMNFLKDSYCYYCRVKTPQSVCALCNIRVRGIYSACLNCGHGGHLQHMKSWFEKRSICPSFGCKCQCLEAYGSD